MSRDRKGRAPAYAPLWCKSNYSFLEGANHPEELVESAAENRLPAIAITDRDGVYGIVRAHERARSKKVRLIVGSEVTIDGGASVILLAETRAGYANLCAILSGGHLRNPKGRSSVSWGEVCERSSGLVALWLRGSRDVGIAGAALGALREAYPDRLYAVIARHRRVDDVRIEREARACAAAHRVPLVAATEVLYHLPERRMLQDVLTCIRHGVTLMEAGTRLRPNAEHFLKGADEFLRLYGDDPTLCSRTIEIAERCAFSLAELEYRYPEESVPPGHTTAAWLRKLTFAGALKRYPEGVPENVATQLEKELSLIEELRYCGYFLTMWEIVHYCEESGILCQGRGSAANSAVCYCLGITAVDPTRTELLFERFLSRERSEPPDIDLDIEHRRREEVIQHMYRKYGRDRAAMVANVVRYRPRSAVREVGKAFGISEVTLDRCSKLLPHWEGDLGSVLKEAGLDLAAPATRHLLRLSREITGFPRHLSIHPGGFLLGSEPVTRIVPIENAAMPDRTVIQWDKYDIEALNLFKVDLLGLGALTHLDYCFRLLKAHYKTDLSFAAITPDDPEVFAMMRRADTVGVFQIESRAQMAMLPRLKPKNYYDLVIEISLVRPGPITGGMVHPYLRRRSEEEKVVYPHDKLKPVLERTLGIPLFQEQVMKLAVIAADYSPGEADQLRRDMASWRQSGRIEQHRDKLISRMVANGIGHEFAERVFAQIRGFGEYGFPESHAASFALIAYATAHLKHHYPDVFTCAILNAWPMGFYFPSTIIDDAKRHRVRVLPIDVLRSDWDCTLEPREDSREHAVRMGLRYVKGLGKEDWERIRGVREERRPGSVAELMARAGLPSDSLERLAESGALECFGVHRRSALWSVLGGKAGPSKGPGNARREESLVEQEERSPDLPELTPAEAIDWDYLFSEHSTRGHIVEPYRARFASKGLPDAARVSTMRHGERVSYAGYVICRQMPGTAKGVLFMTLEDESGFVNVVVWQKVFAKHRTTILTNWLLGVVGHLQVADGVVHVVADSFWKPEVLSSHADYTGSSHDFS